MTTYCINQALAPGRIPQRLNFHDQDFWQIVIESPEIFVFLDFDGTLAEIAPTPADVFFSEPRQRWLNDFHSLPGCSVGIVSGRPINELKRLVGLDQIFYIGCHGLEWAAPEGTFNRPWSNRVIIDTLRSLREELCRALAGADGIIVEDKGIALALHFRRADGDTALLARQEFVRAVHKYQQQGVKLELLAGKDVIEVKPTGMTKADAVTQILANYASTALPIYIGDDRSDEAAFAAIAEKGMAILVDEKPRKSAAARFLKNPTEVYLFLRCLTHMREKRDQTQN